MTVVKCVAHSLDLMLEDISKVPYFGELIEDQKRIVRFITCVLYKPSLQPGPFPPIRAERALENRSA